MKPLQLLPLVEYTDKFIELTVFPGWNCVDVGSNVGTFSEQMLGIIGPGGHLIAIDPMKKFFDKMLSRLGNNKNVEFHNLAVWNESEYHKSVPNWYAVECLNNPGNAGIFPGGADTPVSFKRLDEIISSRRVNFIKVDVEGMELDVIASGMSAISIWKPAILFETRREFEAGGKKIFEPIYELLKPFGYELFNYTPEKGLYPVDVNGELGCDTLAKVGA